MTEPIAYAFTNTGVFYTVDGTNFVINTTANSTLSALGNFVVLSYSNVIIGNSTINNYINSTAWSGTANVTSISGTANNTLFVGSTTAANVVSNSQLQANLSNYTNTAGLNAFAVSYSNAQSLTANQASQSRSNIGITKKNYIINGGHLISQEWGSTGISTSGLFPTDQFQFVFSSSTGVFTAQRIANPTTGGSPYRLYIVINTADTSVSSTEYLSINHLIEGYRIADLKSGSSAAKFVTLQFGCNGPAGTYCVAIRNGAFTRSYVTEYTIAPGEANTDVVKSVTFQCDTTGSWNGDNGLGFCINWMFMAGSGYFTTPNIWSNSSSTIATANQFNLAASTSNVFQLFDISLTEGAIAPPFQLNDYTYDLRECQRYWFCTNPDNPRGGGVGMYGFITNTTNFTVIPVYYPEEMRVIPTKTWWNNGTQNKVRTSATGVVLSLTSPTIVGEGRRGHNGLVNSGTIFTVGAGYDCDVQMSARMS